MGVFQPIKLEWKGEPFTVPADRVMGAIAVIEDVVTLKEIYEAGAKGKVKLSRIASAYGALLRYAGAKVEDDEVYEGMFAVDSGKAAAAAVTSLLSMMVPPNAGGKPNGAAGKSQPAAVPSSKKPSKQRSAPGA